MEHIYYNDFDGNDLVLIFNASIDLTLLKTYLFIMITIYDLILLVELDLYFSSIKQCDVISVKLSNLPF